MESSAPPNITVSERATLWPRADMTRLAGDSARSQINSRWIIPPAAGGWDVVVFEWELRKAHWTDEHPHIEVNYVVEGELHVECDGAHLVAGPGDTISVPAGKRASYFAPVYTRTVGCYGTNAGVADAFGAYRPI